MQRHGPVSFELIVPVYNEASALEYLFQRLDDVFPAQALLDHQIDAFRVIFVDDGSTDETAAIIARRIRSGYPATLLRLSRNFGHQNALSAGLEASRAGVVGIIDADLQDPPEVLLEMLTRWRQGADIVYGVRRKRQENFLKVFAYWAFYRLLAVLSEVRIPMDSGDFSLMDRQVVDNLVRLPEKLRFPRGLRSWVGFRQEGLEYDRGTREHGRSKYTFRKLYRLATDGIASQSIRPLRIMQMITILYTGLMVFFAVLFFREYLGEAAEPDRIRFLLTWLLLSISTLVITFGIYIMSAYLGRTYLEVKGRPCYIIAERIGLPSEPEG